MIIYLPRTHFRGTIVVLLTKSALTVHITLREVLTIQVSFRHHMIQFITVSQVLHMARAITAMRDQPLIS
jgi:hypothetical protein